MKILTLTPPSSPIRGTVRIPGSKSYTNRALILAALAEGESVLRSASLSNDSLALLAGLGKLGVQIDRHPERLKITGVGGRPLGYQGAIDVGPAGTTMRFLTSFCALAAGGDVVLQGSERMHQRPIGDLVEAWRVLGADIEYLGTEGCPPLRIRGKDAGEYGDSVSMPGQISSQFMSSLLLVSPVLPRGLDLHVEGEQISRSYMDMTFSVMESFGVPVHNQAYRSYRVKPGPLVGREYQVEGDASGASYFWGLAAVGGGAIRVQNVSSASVQGDAQFPRLLEQMGCRIEEGREADGLPWIELESAAGLRGVEVDMEQMPDTAMTLAVVAACAQGETKITGLSTLRHKETDRLQATRDELASVGIDSAITDASITVVGGQPRGAQIRTYDDHRMAMSFALLGAVCQGMKIEEPEVVGKSFPDFWQRLAALGVGVEEG